MCMLYTLYVSHVYVMNIHGSTTRSTMFFMWHKKYTKNTQIYETHNYSIIPNLSLYYLGESKIVIFMDVIAISSLKFLSVKITN